MAGIRLQGERSVDKEFAAMESILQQIRSHVHFQNSPIIVAVEGNLGQEASHLYNFIGKLALRRVFHISERPDMRAGVLKTERSTNEYIRDLNQALLLGGLSFAQELYTLRNRSADEEKSRLRNMMEAYSLVPKSTNRHPAARPSWYATGKLKGMQDDLLIAVMMCIHFRIKFWENRTLYGELHELIRTLT